MRNLIVNKTYNRIFWFFEKKCKKTRKGGVQSVLDQIQPRNGSILKNQMGHKHKQGLLASLVFTSDFFPLPNLLKAQQKHQCQQEAKTRRGVGGSDFWRGGEMCLEFRTRATWLNKDLIATFNIKPLNPSSVQLIKEQISRFQNLFVLIVMSSWPQLMKLQLKVGRRKHCMCVCESGRVRAY